MQAMLAALQATEQARDRRNTPGTQRLLAVAGAVERPLVAPGAGFAAAIAYAVFLREAQRLGAEVMEELRQLQATTGPPCPASSTRRSRRRSGDAQAAPACAASVVKLSPQPHSAVAFGLRNTKVSPRPCLAKSISVPSTSGRLVAST